MVRKRRTTTLIKSNNAHLAGGEKIVATSALDCTIRTIQ